MERLVNNTECRRIAPDGTAATTFILAAGTTDVNTGGVDTRGFNELTFMLVVGIMSASSSVDAVLEYSDDDVTYTTTGVSITQISATDDNEVTLINVHGPLHRYYRLALTRGNGGNSVIDGVFALLSKPSQAAVTQGATVSSTKIVADGGA